MISKTKQNKTPIAYPTILLFISICIGYGVLYNNYVYNTNNVILTLCIGTFLAYSIFTIIHEASHGNIARGNKSFFWVEEVIGWIASAALFFPYKAFVVIHLQHHAHTNDSEQDPDGYVRGNNAFEVFFRCLTLVGHYYVSSIGKANKKNAAMFKTRGSTFLFILFNIIIVSLIIYFEQWNSFLIVFLLPAIIAAPILGFTFDWLPHYPHNNMDKYHNTRIVSVPGLEFLSFFQSYHLIHHLYPRVPFYNYKKRYRKIKDELVLHKSPVEGFKKGEKKLFSKKNTYSDIIDGTTWNYSLEVEKVESLTHNASSIQFKNLEDVPFKYKAGQYVVISMLVNGEKVSRCYSICSNPNKGKLKVGVKRVKGGKLSNTIIDNLKKGIHVNVSGPFGEFQFKKNVIIENHVFIAGGSGITPILAIVEKILEDKINNVVLIYGCRSSKDVMFYERLKELEKQYSNQFRLLITYDILTKEYQEKMLSGLTDKSGFYLCGPKLMMEASKQALRFLEVDEKHIVIEDFATESDELKGEEFIVNYRDENFKVFQSETILEGAIRNKVAIPYACNKGQCGTCKLTLEEGEISWKNETQNVLLENEKEAGYILSCMCKPTSDLKIKE